MRSRPIPVSGSFVPIAALLFSACSSNSTSVPPPAGLTYGDIAPVYSTCSSITNNVPLLGAGSASSYTISPALPAGLTLDATSGVISGTPIEPIALSTFTVTAANAVGATTADITLRVDSTLTTGISYGGVSLAHLVSTSASWIPTVDTGTVETWTVQSGILPGGLTLDPATGEISGTPTQPGQHSVTIAASNCEPVPATAVVDFDIQAWFPSSMYVTNNANGATISSALWDAPLHGLRPTGWISPSTGFLTAPTLSVDGSALFVADSAAIGIQEFAIDPTNGRLAAQPTTISLPSTPTDIAITPDGAFLYACGPGGTVYMFSIEPQSNFLTGLNPSSISTSSSPLRMAMDSTGAWLVIVDDVNASIECFAIDGASGALTLRDTIGSPTIPGNVTFAPSGNRVYVASSNSTEIRGYAVDAVSGVFTELPNSPYGTGLLAAALDLVFDPTGRHAYAPLIGLAEVRAYDVDEDTGALSWSDTNSIAIEAPARGITIDPRGERAYVTMSNDHIQVLMIEDDGKLVLAAEPSLVIRSGATDIVFTKTPVPHQLVSDALYAVSFADDLIYNFQLDSGTLQPMLNASTSAGGDNIESLTMLWMTGRLYDMQPTFNFGLPLPGGFALSAKYAIAPNTHELQYDGWFPQPSPTRTLVVDPSERFGYEVCDDGLITTTFDGDGYWVIESSLNFNSPPTAAAINPGGSLLFTVDPIAGRLSAYAIDPNDGHLDNTDNTDTWSDPVEVLVTPSGRFVYTLCRGPAVITEHTIDVTLGHLQPLGAAWIGMPSDEVDAAISPDGRFLVVASTFDIGVFSINVDPTDAIDDGSLQWLGLASATNQPIQSIEFDNSGAFLYVGLEFGLIETCVFTPEGALQLDQLTTSGHGVRDIALHSTVR